MMGFAEVDASIRRVHGGYKVVAESLNLELLVRKERAQSPQKKREKLLPPVTKETPGTDCMYICVWACVHALTQRKINIMRAL